ncbi:sensor histidine kinase [Streptomyces sp. NPDC058373]|uniref:sensor histidine kinase n=1 Tax=Streptomyces sp. NPDC058373 TaxID=3346465 RepID=UPI0036536C8E
MGPAAASTGVAAALVAAAGADGGMAVTALCALMAGAAPGRARTSLLVWSAGVVLALLAVTARPEWGTYGGRFVAAMALAWTVPWFAGRFVRQYRELVRAGWERARRLERERALVAEQARLRERARIAQDMHDLLGHDLNLLALGAGAFQLRPGLDAESRQAAAGLRACAGEAVERLGTVVGLLRADAPGPPEDPATLAERAAATGMPVTLDASGDPAPVPDAVRTTTARVVQEALTNAAKHAPGAATEVTIRHKPARTRVRVHSAAPPAPPPAQGGGLGLTGLAERVRVAGGEFTAGPDGGGFTVEATLPHTPAAPAPAPPAAPAPEAARPRPARTLLGALLVPLCAVALLTVGLRGWELYQNRAAVLTPQQRAQLHVGQDQRQAERLLPARQTVSPPRDRPAPQEDGTACRYYALTADPFDDRSGDAYQVCFREGEVSALDRVAGG